MAPVPGMTPGAAAAQILKGIGAPVTQSTVGSMVGWMNAEGGNWHNSASFNPLNTTLNEPGARSINGVGVKAYGNWGQGIGATVATLKQPNMAGIVQALRTSNPRAVASAIGSSPWGTSAGLVNQTIGAATGQHYNLAAGGGSLGLPKVSSPASSGSAPTTGFNTTAAEDAALMSTLNRPINMNGHVGAPDMLSNLVHEFSNPAYVTHGQAPAPRVPVGGTAVGSVPTTGEVAPSQSAGAAKLLRMASAVTGSGYNQGAHATVFNQGEGAVKVNGTDCSGFVSWLMGPQGLGIWNSPQTTPTIPTAPGLQSGQGKVITIWNNAQPGNAGHVFVKIGNAYYASEGGVGIHELSQGEVMNYLQHGSDGGHYEAFHPVGY